MKPLIFLLFISVNMYCQKFSFDNTTDTKVKKTLSIVVKNALDSKNKDAFDQALKTIKIKQVYSLEEPILNDYSDSNKQLVPLSIDLYRRIISGQLTYDFFDVFIKNSLDINCELNEKNLLYTILDHVATNTIENSKKQKEFLEYYALNYKINQEFRTLKIPLYYLLNSNYVYNGNKYKSDFIDQEIIILLLKNGAPVNSYDSNGNSLLDFAIMSKKNDLINYLADNGVDFTKINKEGKNSLFSAIETNNENLVKTYLEKFNGTISPTYLQGIKIGDANIYRSKTIAKMLINESLKNVTGLGEAVIFCYLFYNDKNAILNPLNFRISDDEIPTFVGLFDNEKLSTSERNLINKFEINYINDSKNFNSLISRLHKIPLFEKPVYYYSNIDEMAKGDRVALLENEIKKIDDIKFKELKTKLYAELRGIKIRVEIIQNEKIKIDKFYNSVKNTENAFWITPGDGASFWEYIALDDKNKFKKYKLCLLSKFENTSNESYKTVITVRYFYIDVVNTFSLFSSGENKGQRNFIDVTSYLEIPANSTKFVVTVCDFKEETIDYGILGSGSRTIDNLNPYSSWYNKYDGAIDNKYKQYQESLINQLRENNKLDTKKGWGNAYKEYCENCIIDIKNSKGPKWENNIWNDLIEKNGIIAMKNTSKYEFKQIVKNNKLLYKFIGNVLNLEKDKIYTSFDEMVLDLERTCKKINCE